MLGIAVPTIVMSRADRNIANKIAMTIQTLLREAVFGKPDPSFLNLTLT